MELMLMLTSSSHGQVQRHLHRGSIPLPTLQKAYEAKQLQVQILATYEGPMAAAQARIGEGHAIEAARKQNLPLLNISRSSHARHSASCGPAVEGNPQ